MSAKLLIVDDQDLILRIIQAAVKPLGPETMLARSGSDALAAIGKSGMPDGVILDYSMPGKDGVETLQCLRDLDGGAEVPVIMLTARDQTAIREAAAGLGVFRFMTKPFSPAILCRATEEMLQSKKDA